LVPDYKPQVSESERGGEAMPLFSTTELISRVEL
jgi:hypothetical protein